MTNISRYVNRVWISFNCISYLTYFIILASISYDNTINCWPSVSNISNFSLAFTELLRDIISTLIALTTIFGLFNEFAFSLLLFIIHIVKLVNTRGILKENLTNDQCEEAFVHSHVIASHLSSIFLLFHDLLYTKNYIIVII